MSKGRLIKRVARPKPCWHDAPGPLLRWARQLWVGCRWQCGMCDAVLVLGWSRLGELMWGLQEDTDE